MQKKKMAINIIVCLVSFITTIGINFFVTPYITENVSEEAYGFISLATNFVNYASIITLAINSMAARFISIAVFKNDEENANKYFTSVFFANIFMILILIIPFSLCILYLEKFISISSYLVFDVKLLFSVVFINFFVSLINSTYSVATYAGDKMELYNLRNMESGILKVVVIFLLFWILGANVVCIGIGSLAATLYMLLFNIGYTKKLLPFIKVKKIYFDIKKIFEIIKAGIWNTITRIGQMLSDGIDLLITNIFISPTAMGQLSIAKMISSSVNLLTSSLVGIFQPNLTRLYAKNDKRIVSDISFSMKITSLFTNILLIGIMCFGYQFYKLWLPSSDANLLTILTVITLSGSIIGNAVNVLFSVYTITNRVKLNSIVTLLCGFLSILIVYILLKLELFANPIIVVASVSVVIGIIKNMTFTPMYAAKCLNQNLFVFYKALFRSIFSNIVLAIFFVAVSKLFVIDTWLKLITIAIVCGSIGFLINMLLLFNFNDIKKIFLLVRNKLKGDVKNEAK